MAGGWNIKVPHTNKIRGPGSETEQPEAMGCSVHICWVGGSLTGGGGWLACMGHCWAFWHAQTPLVQGDSWTGPRVELQTSFDTINPCVADTYCEWIPVCILLFSASIVKMASILSILTCGWGQPVYIHGFWTFVALLLKFSTKYRHSLLKGPMHRVSKASYIFQSAFP